MDKGSKQEYSLLFQLKQRHLLHQKAVVEERDLGQTPAHSATFTSLDFEKLEFPGCFKRAKKNGQPLVKKDIKEPWEDERWEYVEEFHEAIWALYPGSEPEEVLAVLKEMQELSFDVVEDLKKLEQK